MKFNKKAFIVLLAMLFVLGLMGTVYASSPATITETAIAGVTVPAYTASPVTTATATDQYTASVTWSPADAAFAANKVYTATIILTPKAGYTLTGVTANYFTVAGATLVTNAIDSGVVNAVFPETAANVVAISATAIAGVTVPAYTATPVITAAETDQYTAAVTWSPADATFAANTVYTATITLTPKAGYTLTGVTANYFTVAGATSVTNTANSGVVTAVFSATGTTANNGQSCWNKFGHKFHFNKGHKDLHDNGHKAQPDPGYKGLGNQGQHNPGNQGHHECEDQD
jgi:nitrogenase subunit NifH